MTDSNALSASAPELPKFGPALRKLWPHADMHIPGLTVSLIEQAPALFSKSGIGTEMEIANMMGEFTEECGGGFEVEENLNYRAAQLHAQWPLHFSMQEALEMQHQPVMIANQAYNGRMGNRMGTNDGWNYRGRGPAQTTGREAYGILGEAMKVDLINRPELINDNRYFLACGVVDFVVICKCLIYAQRDDEVNETRHLNGGMIGLAQREASIKMWKHMLGVA